ncbi:MAG: hypothetical protein ABFD89_03550 [Bryobacteraceae bacterium]
MPALDFSKPVQTRDGRPARIYATDGGGKYPIHGAVFLSGDSTSDPWWVVETWTAEGRVLANGPFKPEDLEQVPETFTHEEILVFTMHPTNTGSRRLSLDRFSCSAVGAKSAEIRARNFVRDPGFARYVGAIRLRASGTPKATNEIIDPIPTVEVAL